ncbi:MAG: COX15/CtaA family protein [Proteobacteria bacterium]|nr:COX15/CtaA family protein [Pseudomonadota bacterium]
MTAEARWIARIARAGFVLVLMIVASSAFIRLNAGVPDAPVRAIEAARVAHRISASLAGLLVLVIAGLVFTRDAKRLPDIVLAGATLAATLVLAWIGRYSGPDASAAVLVSNLAGGLALSTLLWAVAARHSLADEPASRGAGATLAFLTLLAVALQCVTGAMTVTEFVKVGPVHHALGGVAFALCAWLGVRLARTRGAQFEGYAVIALAALQAALGVAALALSLPLWLVLAHNVGAALLLAALAQVTVQRAGAAGAGATSR